MTANSDKSKQNNKAAHRVLAGVLCGASVLSLVLSLVMPPISQAIANDIQTVSTEETETGGGSSSESAAVGNTSEDAETAGAMATVEPGIHKPTSIGIGTDVTTAQDDPGVATFVGGDMYVGGKPAEPSYLTPDNVAGSYAVEAEGLTVVQGKLALNPLKESWPYTDANNKTSGAGFRFGTVGFGAQFRPSAGSVVLAVAGLGNATSIQEIQVGTKENERESASVGAWTKGAWVGQQKRSHNANAIGFGYTAQIAGPITYWRDSNYQRQSVVTKQGNYYEGGNAGESSLFNRVNFLNNINGKDYSNYSGKTGYLTTLSNQLNSFAKTGEVSYGVAPAYYQDNRYTIYKYDKTDCNYGLVFDESDKTINTDCADTSLNGKQFKNSERLITFKGDNTSMQQVFTIDASQLSNIYNNEYYRGVDFAFEGIPKGASVVVNVTGSSNIEFHNGWRFWWNGTEISRGYETRYSGTPLGEAYATASQSVMWNFVDTQSLTIRGGIAGEDRADWGYGGAATGAKWTDDDPAAAMIGSILVPDGSFDDHVTTNGRVYVGVDFSMNSPKVAAAFGEGNSASVIDMDQERHNFPWSGTYTPGGSSIAWSKVDAADGKPLAGSEWAIYATEDNARNDKSRIVSIVDNGTNDSNPTVGTIQFNHLNQKANIGDSSNTDYFTYYIREVKAPEGYELSNEIYTSKMFHTGDELNLVGNVDTSGNENSNPQSAIPNAKITGTVSWTKVENGDAKFAPLAGSEWKLAKLGTDGSTEAQSWTVSDQSASGETTWADTDTTSGKFTLEGLLPGTYRLVETQAPFGYEKNPMEYEFKVSSTNGSITWTEGKKPTFDNDGNAYISDSLTTTSVTIPVTKSVRNTDWPKDGGNYVPFDFRIEATGDYATSVPFHKPADLSIAPAAGETDATKLNNITAAFGTMTFNKSCLSDTAGTAGDYAKTYTYTVKEVVPTTGAIDKLRYSKAEYQVAVTVKTAKDKTTGKYSGLTTLTTVTQVKDDMGNAINPGKVIGDVNAPANAIPASTFTNVKVLTDLPLTGAGWTENSMLLVGAGLMLLGGIAAGAYWFATKRRQDDPPDGAGR